jgi:pilus assembly protein CpaF
MSAAKAKRGNQTIDGLADGASPLVNTGHSGTVSTVHASSAQQAVSRFTSCVLQSGVELPYRAIKTNIGDSLNVILQLERRPGIRFVSEALELKGCDAVSDRYELIAVYGNTPH